MGRVLTVSSGKGGVGKSTVAIGIGTALNHAGQKTLLVDLDEGLRCLDAMLCVSDDLVFDLSDALSDFGQVDRCVYPVPRTDCLWLMAAPPAARQIDSARLGRFAEEISRRYDFVLFDFPAGVKADYYACFPPFTEHLVVCNTDRVCVRDACEIARALGDTGGGARLIVNRLVKSRVTKNLHRNIDQIIDTCGLRLLGIVPEDPYVLYAAAREVPVSVGPAAMAFHRIAARLCGLTVPLRV